MCLLVLLIVMVYLLVALFVQTAFLLLPWTILSGVLGTLGGWGAARRVPAFRGRESLAAGSVAFAATLAIGFAAFMLVPPTPPPPGPPQDPIKLLTELPRPDVTLDNLQDMFPIHLTITAVLAALIAVGFARRRPSPLPDPEPLTETPRNAG